MTSRADAAFTLSPQRRQPKHARWKCSIHPTSSPSLSPTNPDQAGRATARLSVEIQRPRLHATAQILSENNFNERGQFELRCCDVRQQDHGMDCPCSQIFPEAFAARIYLAICSLARHCVVLATASRTHAVIGAKPSVPTTSERRRRRRSRRLGWLPGQTVEFYRRDILDHPRREVPTLRDLDASAETRSPTGIYSPRSAGPDHGKALTFLPIRVANQKPRVAASFGRVAFRRFCRLWSRWCWSHLCLAAQASTLPVRKPCVRPRERIAIAKLSLSRRSAAPAESGPRLGRLYALAVARAPTLPSLAYCPSSCNDHGHLTISTPSWARSSDPANHRSYVLRALAAFPTGPCRTNWPALLSCPQAD